MSSNPFMRPPRNPFIADSAHEGDDEDDEDDGEWLCESDGEEEGEEEMTEEDRQFVVDDAGAGRHFSQSSWLQFVARAREREQKDDDEATRRLLDRYSHMQEADDDGEHQRHRQPQRLLRGRPRKRSTGVDARFDEAELAKNLAAPAFIGLKSEPHVDPAGEERRRKAHKLLRELEAFDSVETTAIAVVPPASTAPLVAKPSAGAGKYRIPKKQKTTLGATAGPSC